ncbi:hypothetical protein DAMA08_018460 [Martiniozyma asiatica (nom. inval.)]|nr:hypothetical protein DAMA08_018460 [Martiniozyma asiatica]
MMLFYLFIFIGIVKANTEVLQGNVAIGEYLVSLSMGEANVTSLFTLPADPNSVDNFVKISWSAIHPVSVSLNGNQLLITPDYYSKETLDPKPVAKLHVTVAESALALPNIPNIIVYLSTLCLISFLISYSVFTWL